MKFTIQKIDRLPEGDGGTFEYIRVVGAAKDCGINVGFTVFDGVRKVGHPIPADISEIATDRIRKFCRDFLADHPEASVPASPESCPES